MTDTLFSEVEQLKTSKGAEAAIDALIESLKKDHQYEQLFDALLLKRRYQLGLPLIQPASSDGIPDELAGSEPRVMDCTDCHNRPAHAFESADRALNHALAKKRIDPSLPMVKKTARELLERSYESHAEAERELIAGLDDFYQSQYPEVHAARGQAIRQAGRELAAIYQRNVFPEMKVGWGTYPNQIGHTEFPGCFRCHDDLHATADGETITQDCGVCHELLAIEEPAPEILSSLGIAQ